MKTKIKKGDKVKILDESEIYSTFEKMFIELGFKNTKLNDLEPNCIDLIWDVVNVVKHPYEKRKIAFIKSDGLELLITIKGLELIESLPTYQLTKSQIIEIAENGSLVKELFPDVFEVELEVRRWYKFISGTLGFYQGENAITYGFHIDGNEFIADNKWFFSEEIKKVERLATPEEVETTLKDYYEKEFNIKYEEYKFENNTLKGKQKNWVLWIDLFKDGVFLTPNDVIKVIETYGKDKLITLIEAYNGKN